MNSHQTSYDPDMNITELRPTAATQSVLYICECIYPVLYVN